MGELRAALATSVEGWKADARLAHWRWTAPDGWHVTLAFLGPVPATEVVRISDAVRRVTAGLKPFVVQVDAVGAFPDARRARVLWCGLTDRRSRLAEVTGAVREALGVEADAPLKPHVTVARSGQHASDVRPFLASARARSGSMTVDHVEILRSHLGSGPARYETLARIELGGAADG